MADRALICPGWVKSPRIPGESATSEPGCKAEEISSKSDIAAGMSEVEGEADVDRTRPVREVLAISGH